MRVLGIDPGTYRMGAGVVDSEAGTLSHVYSTALSPNKASTLPQRLHYLHDRLVELIQQWEPSVAAVEEPFVSHNVRAAMAVGQAQAVAMVAAASQGIPVSGYSPREVKRAVTDYGGSSKEQVQEMVGVLLGLDQMPESSDVADALAVAICHINASRIGDLDVRE